MNSMTRVEIPHTVIAEDFLPKVRDDGGPL